MCDNYSSVWLEVWLPHHKKFLVGQTYREWQLPNQGDRSSLGVPEQLARWTTFLDQSERALDTGLEVHLLGDLNINHCNWTEPSLPGPPAPSALTGRVVGGDDGQPVPGGPGGSPSCLSTQGAPR